MGSIEKVMVAGILVIICVILGIAIWGAESLDDGSLEVAQASHKQTAPDKAAGEANHNAAAPTPKPELKTDGKPATTAGDQVAQVSPPATEPAAPVTAETDVLAPPVKPEQSKTATPAKTDPPASGKKEAQEATPDKNAVWQYTVKKGDTFSSIAQRFYGSASAATRIARLNEDLDEHGLHLGQVLTMPPVTGAAQGKATASWYAQKEQPKLKVDAVQGQQGQQRTYIVREGDTLIRIAREVLKTERWQKLYELNRDRLESATSLKPGQELLLPSEN